MQAQTRRPEESSTSSPARLIPIALVIASLLACDPSPESKEASKTPPSELLAQQPARRAPALAGSGDDAYLKAHRELFAPEPERLAEQPQTGTTYDFATPPPRF